MSATAPTETGSNYTVGHFGPWNELDKFSVYSPLRKAEVLGRTFLKEVLGATGSQISFNKLPPNEAVPYFHAHKLNEEIYIIVQGEGEFQVDEDVFPIKEGSAVRVACAGDRCLRNTSATVPMIYFCVQVMSGSLIQFNSQDGIPGIRVAKWAEKS